MKHSTLAPLFAIGLLVACDEAPPSETDATTSDVVEDAVADVAIDTPDTAPDAVDTAPDVADTADSAAEVSDVVEDTHVDAADTADTADAPDTTDVPLDMDADTAEVGDTGSACTAEGAECAEPYECIGDVCRLPIADTTWTESDFDITEPEELTRLFEFFKSFAGDVKFLVLDVRDGDAGLPATYGAANVVDDTTSPIQVRYQNIEDTGEVVFRPVVGAEAPLDGDAWATDPFLYALRATATIEFPGLDPVTANFGLDAADVVVSMRRDVDEETNTSAQLIGTVSREEAEYRTMADRDEIPGFAELFCIRTRHDPGAEWNLSDILDCNEAVMDVDLDDDGTNDAYRVVIDAVFEAAVLVE